MMGTGRAAVTDGDREYVRSLFPELAEVSDQQLAAKVVEIWAETWKESRWQRIEDAPKNPETVDVRRTALQHTRSVTRQAMAMAKVIQESHGLPVDMDVIIAGGLLHDVSKLVEYEPENGGAAGSRFGKLIQHGAYGVHKGIIHGLSLELLHIISGHTPQSRMPPKTLEAMILGYADFSDSEALAWEAGKPMRKPS